MCYNEKHTKDVDLGRAHTMDRTAVVYLDNMEDPWADSEYQDWFRGWIQASPWGLMYSTRRHIVNSRITPTQIPSLEPAAAKAMFLRHWQEETLPPDEDAALY
jgi:hypothetical protein